MKKKLFEFLVLSLEITSNFYYTYVHRFILNVKQSSLTSTLNNNAKWTNKYNGERCFVLGNGPSLKEHNLSLLENEFVFTVNQIMRYKDYPKIKSNFHVLLDPGYFNLNPNDLASSEVIDYLHKINTEGHQPLCIFPISGKGAIEKLGLDNELNILYVAPYLRFHESYNSSIDLSKYIPNAPTVVQMAVFSAIAMGFKEIYLLGCDMTGYESIKERMNDYNDNKDTHIYDLSENEKERLKIEREERTNENIFYGYARMFTYYRRLREYCNNRGIKLINSTRGGVLDNIPRIKFEEVLRDDKS